MRYFLVLLAFVFVFPSAIGAEEIEFVSVKPDKLFVRLQPGEERINYLSLRNFSEKETNVILRVTAVEVYDSYGHIKKASPHTWSLQNWIRLEQSSYVVPANKSIKIPFTIKVPPAAFSGSYSGAIIVETTSKELSIEKGTVVYANVGSLAETELRVESFGPEGTSVNMTLHNQGNYIGQVSGTVTWYSLFGHEIDKEPLHPLIIWPGKFLTLCIPYSDRFPGIYKADVDLYYANRTKRIRKITTVVHIPVQLPLIVGAAGIGILLLIYKLQKKHGGKK